MTSTKSSQKTPNNLTKYITIGIIVALLLISLGGHKRFKKRARGSKKKLQCQEKYNGTTICNYDDHPKARVIVVTPSDKDLIVSLHNHFRTQVEPSAANMQKMIWDEKLARFALKWARVCKYGHDNPKERTNPEYQAIPIGQNVAYGYRDWTAVINLWHSEVHQLPRGQNLNDDRVWTKQLSDKTARIGCGVAYCPQFRRCYVCNYAHGDQGDVKQPYKGGPPCADCPSTCHENLCDCKGKICVNGGRLNLANCKCKCPRIFGGSMCGKLKCPRKDRKRCGKNKPDSYPKNRCKTDLKVRTECPYMCDICQKQKRPRKEGSDKKPKKKKPKMEGKPKKKKDTSKKGKIPKAATKNKKHTSL